MKKSFVVFMEKKMEGFVLLIVEVLVKYVKMYFFYDGNSD